MDDFGLEASMRSSSILHLAISSIFLAWILGRTTKDVWLIPGTVSHCIVAQNNSCGHNFCCMSMLHGPPPGKDKRRKWRKQQKWWKQVKQVMEGHEDG